VEVRGFEPLIFATLLGKCGFTYVRRFTEILLNTLTYCAYYCNMPPKLATLLKYARAERFLPFTVVLNSGTTYSIPNRDLISIPPPEITEDGEEYADYFLVLEPKSHRIIWLDSLTALEAKGAHEEV
jgi:hypothetical protein